MKVSALVGWNSQWVMICGSLFSLTLNWARLYETNLSLRFHRLMFWSSADRKCSPSGLTLSVLIHKSCTSPKDDFNLLWKLEPKTLTFGSMIWFPFSLQRVINQSSLSFTCQSFITFSLDERSFRAPDPVLCKKPRVLMRSLTSMLLSWSNWGSCD